MFQEAVLLVRSSSAARHALHAVPSRDRFVEDWLREDVAAACDALKADTSRAVSVDRVNARLAEVHNKTTAKA